MGARGRRQRSGSTAHDKNVALSGLIGFHVVNSRR
jgi:hypothetical protein